MDPLDAGQDEPAGSELKKIPLLSPGRLALILVVLQLIFTIVTYPFLPEKIPIHWDFFGNVDRYAPKIWAAWLFPLIGVGIYILLRALIAYGPRLGATDSQGVLLRFADRFLVALQLFTIVLQGTTILFALGYKVDVVYVINSIVALLFIFIGNYLGKVPRNYWIGIRTPWSLANDIVWERTHRMAGWLFVLGGLITLFLNFFTPVRSFAIFVPFIVIIPFTVIYSYIVYQRLRQPGREPLSPPFGSE